MPEIAFLSEACPGIRAQLTILTNAIWKPLSLGKLKVRSGSDIQL